MSVNALYGLLHLNKQFLEFYGFESESFRSSLAYLDCTFVASKDTFSLKFSFTSGCFCHILLEDLPTEHVLDQTNPFDLFRSNYGKYLSSVLVLLIEF